MLTLESFANDNTTTTKWKHISKADFTSALREHLADSSTILQHNTNLCGVAVACKAMVDIDPASFVRIAIDLYTKGRTSAIHTSLPADYRQPLFRLRNVDALTVNQRLADNNASFLTSGLDAVTAIVLTSIRHSFNLVLPYDPRKEWMGIAAITSPNDIPLFLTQFSNARLTSERHLSGVRLPRSVILPVTMSDPQWVTVGDSISNHETILALVDANALSGRKSSLLDKAFGNHWLQITSISYNASTDTVAIDVWNPNQSTSKDAHQTFSGDTRWFVRAVKRYQSYAPRVR